MSISAVSSAASGVNAAFARLDASAARTAVDPLANLAGEAVERMTARTELRANVAVLRTADEMTGTLLDMLA
ncbi:flagellar hook protein FlgE [Brevundimonas sp. VNH65]|uniref:flagellar hook protein FlgE n=1 Tax=Brevundimonas sp. VNH65 TaxID=3400917 RepID=UPI003C10B635